MSRSSTISRNQNLLKVAQERSRSDRFREFTFLGGRYLEGKSNVFGTMMNQLREVDNQVRATLLNRKIGDQIPYLSEASGPIKNILDNAKDAYENKEYLVSISYLEQFYVKVLYCAQLLKNAEHIIVSLNAEYFSSLADPLTEEQAESVLRFLTKSKDPKYIPSQDVPAVTAYSKNKKLFKKAGFYKKAGLINWVRSLFSKMQRKSALDLWERIQPGISKDLRNDIRSVLSASDRLLNVLQNQLNIMSRARAERKIADYVKASKTIIDQVDRYSGVINSANFQKHKSNLNNILEDIAPPEAIQQSESEPTVDSAALAANVADAGVVAPPPAPKGAPAAQPSLLPDQNTSPQRDLTPGTPVKTSDEREAVISRINDDNTAVLESEGEEIDVDVSELQVDGATPAKQINEGAKQVQEAAAEPQVPAVEPAVEPTPEAPPPEVSPPDSPKSENNILIKKNIFKKNIFLQSRSAESLIDKQNNFDNDTRDLEENISVKIVNDNPVTGKITIKYNNYLASVTKNDLIYPKEEKEKENTPSPEEQLEPAKENPATNSDDVLEPDQRLIKKDIFADSNNLDSILLIANVQGKEIQAVVEDLNNKIKLNDYFKDIESFNDIEYSIKGIFDAIVGTSDPIKATLVENMSDENSKVFKISGEIFSLPKDSIFVTATVLSKIPINELEANAFISNFMHTLQSLSSESPILVSSFMKKYAKLIQNKNKNLSTSLYRIASRIR
jgi:hypothetical protein